MDSEENLETDSTDYSDSFTETNQPTSEITQTNKKSVIIYIALFFLLLILITLFVFYGLGIPKNDSGKLQVYSTDLYTIEYPDSWTAYDVQAVDTQLESILILPPAATPLIQQSTTTPLKSVYDIKKTLEANGHQFITMGGAYIYTPYVPVEQRSEFFKQLAARAGERAGESIQVNAEVTTVNDSPVMLSVYHDEGRVVESASWFAKPDPYGRDKGAETILVGIVYSAPEELHIEGLIQKLIQSADDTIYAKYLEGVPVPEQIDTTGVLSSDDIFHSTTSSIIGVSVPRKGQKIILGVFESLSIDGFSTVLNVLDTTTQEISALDLTPFQSRSEIDSDAYSDQQVFSSDGRKVLLHYDVGIRSSNEELAGTEGFAVFDLNTNSLYKLLPTEENKHVSGFRTENGIGGGYANLYGWVNDQEIIYTCDTRPKKDRSDSGVIPYDDIFVTFDQVSYCVINIETLERRVASQDEMVLTTYTSEMLEQTSTPFFSSRGSDCVSIGTNQCLRVVNGSIYYVSENQILTVADGNYRGFVGWQLEDSVYLLFNEATVNGRESTLKKLNIPR